MTSAEGSAVSSGRDVAVATRSETDEPRSIVRGSSRDDRWPRARTAGRRASAFELHLVSLILGLAYLGAMVFAMLQGYPLAGVGGATFGVAAVIWAIRREPSSSGSDD